MKTRPKGMSYQDAIKKGLCKASDMSEDDYKKLPEDEETGDEAKKSLTAEELSKSLIAYEAALADLAKGDDEGAIRRQVLMAKGATGELSKSESAELQKLLAGDTPAEAGVAEGLKKSLEGTPQETLVDGAPLIQAMTLQVEKHLLGLKKSMEGHQNRNLAHLQAQGELVKSMAGVLVQLAQQSEAQAARLQELETTPVGRRSATSPKAVPRNPGEGVYKSAAGGSQELTKSEVERGLEIMLKSADAKGDRAAVEHLVNASAAVALGQPLPAPLLQAVERVLNPAA